jgi:hypothetical protein
MSNPKTIPIKRTSTAFLQSILILFALAALAFLLWEPHTEGVNAHASLSQMYLDPFVLYVYAASTPFFAALFQAFKLLGYVGQNRVFTLEAVKALRIIKFCALAIIALVALSLLFMIGGDRDDRPGGIFMRLLVSFPSIIVATAAAISERILQNAVEFKSENDLTV